MRKISLEQCHNMGEDKISKERMLTNSNAAGVKCDDTLVSHGCCNQLSQAGWLKTKGIYCLQYWRLEVGSPCVGRTILSLKHLGGNPFHAFPLASLPAVIGVSWFVEISLISAPMITLHSPCASGSLSFILMKTDILDYPSPQLNMTQS